jgi:hypothetical protein
MYWSGYEYPIWKNIESIFTSFLEMARDVTFNKMAVEDRADSHATARMVMMLNHNVCEQQFTGEWASIIKAINSDDKYPCPLKTRTYFRAFKKGATSTEMEEFVKDCEASYFTHSGIEAINKRLVNVADPWALANPGLLAINDCYALTLENCDLSTDGRHFPLLAPVEMRSFLRLIDSRFPNSKSGGDVAENVRGEQSEVQKARDAKTKRKNEQDKKKEQKVRDAKTKRKKNKQD